jgi:hypothetical protein
MCGQTPFGSFLINGFKSRTPISKRKYGLYARGAVPLDLQCGYALLRCTGAPERVRPVTAKKKAAKQRGPIADRLKIRGRWQDAVKKSLTKKKPAAGWHAFAPADEKLADSLFFGHVPRTNRTCVLAWMHEKVCLMAQRADQWPHCQSRILPINC